MDGCLGAFDWLPLGQSNASGVWSVTVRGLGQRTAGVSRLGSWSDHQTWLKLKILDLWGLFLFMLYSKSLCARDWSKLYKGVNHKPLSPPFPQVALATCPRSHGSC